MPSPTRAIIVSSPAPPTNLSKFVLTVTLAFANTACFASDKEQITSTIELYKYNIDLDDPGGLDALAKNNPEHYRIIKEIAENIASKKPNEIAGWLKVDYGITSTDFNELEWLTSHPPKKRLLLVLEGISYRLTVSIVAKPKTLLL